MARRPKKLQIAGGVDPLTAAAIAAAITQHLADEDETAAKPKEPVSFSNWKQKAFDEPSYVQPIHPPSV